MPRLYELKGKSLGYAFQSSDISVAKWALRSIKYKNCYTFDDYSASYQLYLHDCIAYAILSESVEMTKWTTDLFHRHRRGCYTWKQAEIVFKYAPLDLLKKVITWKCDICTLSFYQPQALFTIIKRGDVDIIQWFFANTPVTEYVNMPLKINLDGKKIVKFLVDIGIKLGYLFYIHFILKDDFDTVKWLYQLGSELHKNLLFVATKNTTIYKFLEDKLKPDEELKAKLFVKTLFTYNNELLEWMRDINNPHGVYPFQKEKFSKSAYRIFHYLTITRSVNNLVQ